MQGISKIVQISKNLGLSAIYDKWQELQNMLGNSKIETISEASSLDEVRNFGDLKIFVSSSMGKTLLQRYVNEASHYGATLIFNGLPANNKGEPSWAELAKLVKDISKFENAAIQIDDLAFKKYAINTVPSFVLTKVGDELESITGKESLEYDKLVGNLGIRGALEIIAQEGDLQDIAYQYLNIAKSNN